MKTEKMVYNRIRLRASKRGDCILFPNPCGVGWTGGIVHKNPDVVTLCTPRQIQFGLQRGSSDLIGVTAVKITPDMVGETIGVFTAIEVKKSNWKRPGPKNKHHEEQMNFISVIRDHGGIAGFATSADEFEQIIGEVQP